ncbi:hypothetical protein HPP92_019610 [Vanilla planifolia]|uniref:Uncharacterized protein n=1 Tax=Vanilla planifolia TaxID=51239 RepID=A0A835ULA5_VANPL|nr:hypothetical protein HPP92_019610 [Vanilla planifolia]
MVAQMGPIAARVAYAKGDNWHEEVGWHVGYGKHGVDPYEDSDDVGDPELSEKEGEASLSSLWIAVLELFQLLHTMLAVNNECLQDFSKTKEMQKTKDKEESQSSHFIILGPRSEQWWNSNAFPLILHCLHSFNLGFEELTPSPKVTNFIAPLMEATMCPRAFVWLRVDSSEPIGGLNQASLMMFRDSSKESEMSLKLNCWELITLRIECNESPGGGVVGYLTNDGFLGEKRGLEGEKVREPEYKNPTKLASRERANEISKATHELNCFMMGKGCQMSITKMKNIGMVAPNNALKLVSRIVFFGPPLDDYKKLAEPWEQDERVRPRF